ncbi:MAG: hypothetical protein JSS66_03050 [Armatimonadetes bacterium]|nr:hypothetical protein [Armatimonadota bacterium]
MLLALVVLALQSRSWSKPELFVSITDPAINESSGVGASNRYPGMLYTHNDSGDSARFFRFKKDGAISIVTVPGVNAVDWEDMECVKVGGEDLLYFGDIGDNASARANIKIYKFPEPDLQAASIPFKETYTITYPDGPHNCEALIVDPGSGDIFLATKNSDHCDIFYLPKPDGSGTYVMQKLGTIHPDTGGGSFGRLVTAGDADPSGKHVILRTYSAALEYTVTGAFKDWWKETPVRVAMPSHAQGESIAYGPGGASLFTTSEGSPCPVHRQRLVQSTGGG